MRNNKKNLAGKLRADNDRFTRLYAQCYLQIPSSFPTGDLVDYFVVISFTGCQLPSVQMSI